MLDSFRLLPYGEGMPQGVNDGTVGYGDKLSIQTRCIWHRLAAICNDSF